MSTQTPVIQVRDINKTFEIKGRKIHALKHVTNHVDKGEVLVVIGPSGSGKSTFLRALNGLQPIDSGSIVIDGVELNDPKTDHNKLRQDVGMVFQHFNLFEHKTALENITMPQMVVLKRSKSEAESLGLKLLERVGIGDRGDNYPSELSGGQQQRVAIARSLLHKPALVLADEPTGNLDDKTTEGVLELLDGLVRQAQGTMIVATHSARVASFCDRGLELRDGVLVAANGRD